MDRARQDAFDALYDAHAARLVTQLYALTGDLGVAQECVQEAFARAWQRWGTIGEYEDPVGWVRRAARNLAVSHWRRARRALRGVRGSDVAVDGPDGSTVDLVAGLQALPAAQREALVLRHLVGLDVEVIAAQEEISEAAVRARLSRGRRALEEWLDSKEEHDARLA